MSSRNKSTGLNTIAFISKRLFFGLLSLFAILFIINSITFLTPPRDRALLIYGTPPMYLTEAEVNAELLAIIEEYGFDDPITQQFISYLSGVSVGDFGLRSIFGEDILNLINERIPVTLELLFYSVILYIPGGLIFGAIAGWKENKAFDVFARFSSFFSFSIPPFILGLIFISVFYIALGWFMPGKLGVAESMIVRGESFVRYTNFMSIDGFLNNQPEVSIDALRRLAMPVIALSFSSLGTILLVTRKAMINIRNKDYISTGFAKGLSDKRVLFQHALKNAVIPGLATSSLMVSTMLTELYVIERVFNRNGISELMIISMVPPVNIGIALGFAIYNFIFVSIVMFIFDMILAAINPHKNFINGDYE